MLPSFFPPCPPDSSVVSESRAVPIPKELSKIPPYLRSRDWKPNCMHYDSTTHELIHTCDAGLCVNMTDVLINREWIFYHYSRPRPRPTDQCAFPFCSETVGNNNSWWCDKHHAPGLEARHMVNEDIAQTQARYLFEQRRDYIANLYRQREQINKAIAQCEQELEMFVQEHK